MAKQTPENIVIVHSTDAGKLFIKEEEFFKNEKVKSIMNKLLASKLYLSLKTDKVKR